MPKETGSENPYGYDPETTTVRVGQHDLARLLLMFRLVMREQPPGKWKHMDDYDLSFERLADAVDASSQIRTEDLTMSLCGFSWAEGEGRRVSGLPDCRECRREVQLGADRPRG
ncbi:hypothetical protein ACIP4W_36355 [Streptomyces sp. NPDC088846]|uniref:hypothetical protein n=1 Tax=Streptomyces sp. NPDC088846 TaxID=3365908 RepID=UPI0037F94FDB